MDFILSLIVPKIISVLASIILILLPNCIYFTTSEKAEKYMLPGDEVFSYEEGSNWECGFSKEVLTPDDVTAKKYYIAGYWSNNPATEVLDDMYARAMYLDDNTGRGGVVLCAIDCVGISRKDINDIRKLVIESNEIPNLKSINIAATHAHSAIDTQGLWGEDFYLCGRDDEYMAELKEKTAKAIIDAYKDSRAGKLYVGDIETVDLQDDCRTPITYDKTLTRIRFSPDDGTKDTYFVNFACHAELLGKRNSKVSADFPAYMIQEIEAQTNGANALYFNGAIGGMVTAYEIDSVYNDDNFDCEAYTKQFGKAVGKVAMSVSNEKEIAPIINVKSEAISVPCDNTMLILGRILFVLNNDIEEPQKGKAEILSEVGYLELGNSDVGMFLIPGELYPELENGEFLPADQSATGTEADYTVLSEMTNCERSFVIGLCNDELGYIIPENDYILHDTLPYFNIPHDQFEREHYEETNSVGIGTADLILDSMESLIKSAKG